MKTIFSLIPFLFIFNTIANGQKVDTIYYDKNDQITTFKKCNYYRIARQDSDRVRVYDYDKSGKILMSGSYTSFDFSKEIGPFYFYKKDRIEQLELHEPLKYPEIYSKFSNYLDNIPKQPDSCKLMVTFHKNKTVASIGYVSDCCLFFGPWLYISKKGEPMFLITYVNSKRNGTFEWYSSLDKAWIRGSYRDDKRDGEWQYYDNEGKLRKTQYYKEGKTIK